MGGSQQPWWEGSWGLGWDTPNRNMAGAEHVGSSGLSPVQVALETLPLPSSAQLAKAWCQPVYLLEKNILRVIMPLSRTLRVHPVEGAVVSKEGAVCWGLGVGPPAVRGRDRQGPHR